MTRKKVRLAWIESDRARKASLKKRRSGILKKVEELNILCGVDVFIIVYSPNDGQLITWPSPTAVQQLLIRFQAMPEMARYQKSITMVTYLQKRVATIEEQFKKFQSKNGEMELDHLMQKINKGDGFEGLYLEDLNRLHVLAQEKLSSIKKKSDYIRLLPPLNQPTPPISSQTPNMEGIGQIEADAGGEGEGEGEGANPPDGMTWEEWFNELINDSDNVAGSSNQ